MNVSVGQAPSGAGDFLPDPIKNCLKRDHCRALSRARTDGANHIAACYRAPAFRDAFIAPRGKAIDAGIYDVAEWFVGNRPNRREDFVAHGGEPRIHQQYSFLTRLHSDVAARAYQHIDVSLHGQDVDFRVIAVPALLGAVLIHLSARELPQARRSEDDNDDEHEYSLYHESLQAPLHGAVICPRVFPLGAAAFSYFSISIYIPETWSPRLPVWLLEVCHTQPETRSEMCSSPASDEAQRPEADRFRLQLRRDTAQSLAAVK